LVNGATNPSIWDYLYGFIIAADDFTGIIVIRAD
jgi:hypothetical protein